MNKGLVTLVGGSGFIGRYAARALVKQGWRVRVACRRVHAAIDVRLAGPPGWVDVVQANIRDRASLERAVAGADAVVNLVGILFEHGRQTFEAAHASGAGLLAEVAARNGVKRFVQISAIGADAASKSPYARTKARAEDSVRSVFPDAVILRPSIVFGPEDQFFNRFAGLARSLPVLPAIGGGLTRFQPVYAGDLADAIAASVERPDSAGRTYEIGGPRVYTFNEVFDLILGIIDERRLRVPVPFFMVRPMAYIIGAVWRFVPPFSLGLFGPPPITGAQAEMLACDNVAAQDLPGLNDLGVTAPHTAEAVVPSYLWRFRDYGQFHTAGEA